MRLLILLLFILISSFSAQAKEYTFAAVEKTPYQKALADVLKVAFERLGHTLSIAYLPGKRALLLSDNGKYDGEVGRVLATSKNYPNLIHIPVATGVVEGVAFSRLKGETFKGWDQLKQHRLGMTRGTVWIEKATHTGFNRLFVDDLNSMFKMLEAGRVDYVFGNKRHLEFIKSHGYQAFMLSPAVHETGIYPHVHADHTELIDPLKNVLSKMKSTGELEKLRTQSLKKHSKTID